MNTLTAYIIDHDANEIVVMNDLQSHGIISDLCALPEDVASADCDRAVEWLDENP